MVPECPLQTTQSTDSAPAMASGAPALVCPLDRLDLQIAAGSTELRCGADHTYAVRGGIPRIAGSLPGYADAFGEQWRHYRTTQLDSYTKTSISRDRLRRCLGEELWVRLQQHSPLQVLEAGCGAGRFTEILLQLPAAVVTSTDLSSAVEPNQLNCPQSTRHRIIQCDINHLPFLPGQYDVVICLGVIQHTRDPEQSIADLYRQVRPGGWLVIDHYRPSLSLYTRFGEMLLRPVLKRLPPHRGLAVTKSLTRAFFPLHRAIRGLRPLQMIASRFSPLLTYYHSFPQLSDQLQYEWAELDTHDSLTDYYKHVRTPGSIARRLRTLGGHRIWVGKGGNGVEARCQKSC
jgi:2-polyprenyl-3-methyl-5-hydroxy-6-metoxy-1,4-benzoquinol methylase